MKRARGKYNPVDRNVIWTKCVIIHSFCILEKSSIKEEKLLHRNIRFALLNQALKILLEFGHPLM